MPTPSHTSAQNFASQARGRAHPGARRRDGHDDPGDEARRGGLSRRALRRLEPGGARQQRPAQPEPARRDPRNPLRLYQAPAPTSSRPTRSRRPRSRRPTTACRTSPTSSTARARGSRARPRSQAAREDGRPRFVAGALGPDQPHRVDLAGRRQSRLSRGDVRRSAQGLRRAGARACSTAAPICC